MNNFYTIDKDKWSSLSIFEQMGNIYSEVGRAFNARRNNNVPDSRAAMYRAVDLFNLTAQSLSAHKSPKSKEVLRAKEQFLELLQEPAATEESIAKLDQYFRQFAIAARLRR